MPRRGALSSTWQSCSCLLSPTLLFSHAYTAHIINLTPPLSGLAQWARLQKASAHGSRVGWIPAWRYNKRWHSFTCHPRVSRSGMSHTCLYSPAAERRRTLAGNSFPVTLRVGGWVGLGGMVKYCGLPAQRRSPIQCLLQQSGSEPATIESWVQRPKH